MDLIEKTAPIKVIEHYIRICDEALSSSLDTIDTYAIERERNTLIELKYEMKKNIPVFSLNRKSGNWIYHKHRNLLECSSCHIMEDISSNVWKFCPNCGAEMNTKEIEKIKKRTLMHENYR